MWMRRPRLQRIVGRHRSLRAVAIGGIARLELAILAGHKSPGDVEAIRVARRGAESLLTGYEAYMVYTLARAQQGVIGDMAELGVYQGTSARLICQAKNGATLHLFDTFEGLPEPSSREQRVLARGQFAEGIDDVRARLAPWSGVEFHPGRFPETAKAVEAASFSFVHLDVDLYDSTATALEFFYPRLNPGGVVLSHDYSMLPGVRAAHDDFAAAHGAHIVELPTTQALLIRP